MREPATPRPHRGARYSRCRGSIVASDTVLLEYVDVAVWYSKDFHHDLAEGVALAPEEIMSAETADTAEEIQRVVVRLRDGLAAFLAKAYPGRSRAASGRRAEWAEVLELSPKGFKFDTPTVADYRRRLTTLARGVAADIDA